ncbi:MAG: hypothetical protein VXY86_10480, partial [Pseudomonadota bacterium]|nr:hypothetical protein [Pseudomonadota bacterium]
MSVRLSRLSSGHADLCLQRQHVVRPHIDQGLKFGFHSARALEVAITTRAPTVASEKSSEFIVSSRRKCSQHNIQANNLTCQRIMR